MLAEGRQRIARVGTDFFPPFCKENVSKSKGKNGLVKILH